MFYKVKVKKIIINDIYNNNDMWIYIFLRTKTIPILFSLKYYYLS